MLSRVRISRSSLENAFLSRPAAHWVAYRRANILHRDISVGNVLITPDRKHGLLIDWEFSKRAPPPPTDPIANTPSSRPSDSETEQPPHETQRAVRQPDRTVNPYHPCSEFPYSPTVQGTWQFISVRLLSQPGAEHQLQDDLESFFWVLLWVSLRYTAHNQDPERLGSLLSSFDQVFWGSNQGGEHKQNILMARHIPERVVFSAGDGLNTIFSKFNDLLTIRYEKGMDKANLVVYERLKKIFLPSDDAIRLHPVHIYNQRVERLRTSEFALGILREATKDRSLWSRNDKAAIQMFSVKNVTTKKRDTDLSRLESCREPKKSRSDGDQADGGAPLLSSSDQEDNDEILDEEDDPFLV